MHRQTRLPPQTAVKVAVLHIVQLVYSLPTYRSKRHEDQSTWPLHKQSRTWRIYQNTVSAQRTTRVQCSNVMAPVMAASLMLRHDVSCLLTETQAKLYHMLPIAFAATHLQ